MTLILKADVLKLMPHKLDIGAVFTKPPKDHTSYGSAFQPEERELVFDIDMDSYDPIRKCCKGANVCKKCWKFITIAIKVISRRLEDDFGFRHYFWVYSGRRGAHCWICDDSARKLSPKARASIVEYLNVFPGSETKVEFTVPVHPHLLYSYENTLKPYFEKHLLVEQGLLDNMTDWERMLDLIAMMNPSLKNIRQVVLDAWKESEYTPLQKWEQLKLTIVKENKVKNHDSIMDVIFFFTYPRLDINVTKGVNHLLKAPFCVHPKTGRVCIPIDPEISDEFDPDAVDSIPTLLSQINEYDSHGDDKDKVKNYKKTSLKQPFNYFNKNFLGKLRSERLKNIQKQALADGEAF